jgi:plasmid stabilization system protein ParE
MPHVRSPQADSDLDDIWYYVASETRSADVADRVIDGIVQRFLLLAKYPRIGRDARRYTSRFAKFSRRRVCHLLSHRAGR